MLPLLLFTFFKKRNSTKRQHGYLFISAYIHKERRTHKKYNLYTVKSTKIYTGQITIQIWYFLSARYLCLLFLFFFLFISWISLFSCSFFHDPLRQLNGPLQNSGKESLLHTLHNYIFFLADITMI